MAPIAPGALAESASAKMRFLYSAEYWRRLALTTTSGSGIVLASPGATLRSASLRSASLRSAPGEAKTMPDPEVVVRAKRRQYSAEYKKRILAEADSAKAPGAMGAMLRREGLYSSHLTHW